MATFLRYIMTGGTATVVHFLVLAIGVELFSMYEPIASACGFIIACMVNYTMQYYWTFKTSGSHKVMLAKYSTVTLITFGVNLVIYWLLFEKMEVHYLLAQFIATGVVFILNFFINKHYTFKTQSAS